MIEILENDRYNRRIFPSDWRYSAAIVGIKSFFDYCKIVGRTVEYELTENYMDYNFQDIDLNDSNEEVYHVFLDFVEERYSKYLAHCILERILHNEEIDDESIKLAKSKLSNPTICKKVFKNLKDPQKDREEILSRIKDNRYDLIAETYNKAKSMYVQFIHDGCFRKTQKDMGGISRLDGYYVDLGKKKKSLGYNFDFKNAVFCDEFEFEFIPFAFTNTRKAYFVNCSSDCRLLYKANKNLFVTIEEKANNRNISEVFAIKKVSDYLKYDVEILTKEIDKPYESLMLRRNAIDIFRSIDEKKCQKINRKIKRGEEYIDISEIVSESIIENIKLDNLIIQVMKDNVDFTDQLIKINIKIYEGEKNMEKNTYFASKTAGEVVKVFVQRNSKNKITSYRQKLISALNFKDYERFNTILLQLSSYSGVPFEFAYDLFDDFENNKNIAFTFVNALSEKKLYDKEEKGE
ncbi:type I CRISPR-associated protein Cas8a1/Csx8 [Lachnobacterium bovis]|uniref:type I CRISPR-associated protein Cas8a1/Csx8 n=1 Tax=Lachnobacterium bovis TaxID=140626 RepID=UPI0003B389AE|nr:type I CRISPR-associated protein Cas8a1/Csx8 [Lachnobacterium bovis]